MALASRIQDNFGQQAKYNKTFYFGFFHIDGIIRQNHCSNTMANGLKDTYENVNHFERSV